MAFCIHCGNQLSENARFCTSCGKAVEAIIKAAPNPPAVELYQGQERRFTFLGETLVISPEMDLVNYYKKYFRRLAKIQTDRFAQEYNQRIRDIDSYIEDYPAVFAIHYRPIIEATVNLLMQMGIFDISVEQLEEECVEESCVFDAYCETLKILKEVLEEEQEYRIQKYEQMPSIFFGGVSGIAAAFAYNAVLNKIAENDLSNMDFSDEAREEFEEVLEETREDIYENFYLDCMDAPRHLFRAMVRAGKDVWCSLEQEDERCKGIFQNLKAGRIPMDRLPAQVVLMLELNPYLDPHQMHYLKQCFGDRAETEEILEYFGYYI